MLTGVASERMQRHHGAMGNHGPCCAAAVRVMAAQRRCHPVPRRFRQTLNPAHRGVVVIGVVGVIEGHEVDEACHLLLLLLLLLRSQRRGGVGDTHLPVAAGAETRAVRCERGRRGVQRDDSVVEIELRGEIVNKLAVSTEVADATATEVHTQAQRPALRVERPRAQAAFGSDSRDCVIRVRSRDGEGFVGRRAEKLVRSRDVGGGAPLGLNAVADIFV